MISMAGLTSWISTPSLQNALTDQVAKATILLLVAWGSSFLYRGASASARHQIWTVALLAVLALPLLSVALPAWHVPILSNDTAESTEAPTAKRVELAPAQASLRVPNTSEVSAGSPASSPSAGLPAQGGLGWPKILPLLWALGTVLFLARVLVSAFAAWKVVRDSAPVSDADLVAEVEQLSRQLGIQSAVAVVENPRITMPMAWGLLRQTVLLPSTFHSWTAARRRVVLLHELAHLKRWDCQTLLLARVVTALHWFNPLAWIAVRRLQAEREHACDDLVLNAGTPGADYAQHLLDVARAINASLSPSWAMVAMARPKELEGRLLAILDPHLNRGQMTRLARLGGLVALTLLVLPLASLQPRVGAEEVLSEEGATLLKGAESPRNARLIEVFSTALRDEDAEVRVQAAHSLGALEDASAVPLLEKVVREDASEEVREQAAWALGMMENSAALPALRAALADPSASVRQQAAWALGMIESEAALPELLTALADDDASVRQQSAWALGMIESDSAVASLGTALRDEEAEVRQQAAWALGMIESPSTAGILTSALKSDSSPEVRQQAAWALGMIGDETVLDALLDAMSDDNNEVRKQALQAVGQISG